MLLLLCCLCLDLLLLAVVLGHLGEVSFFLLLGLLCLGLELSSLGSALCLVLEEEGDEEEVGLILSLPLVENDLRLDL